MISFERHHSVVKILLEHSADPNEEFAAETALQIAIENRLMDIIEYLLKHDVTTSR